MIGWRLFITFLKIGLFNFGGGYAMVSFIQHEVVFKQAWLSTAEFTDIVAVSQMTPGPVGINLATYTGYTSTGGVWGAALATVAVCLPSFFLMLFASRYFLKHQNSQIVKSIFYVLRPVVVGLIAAAALVLCNKENFVDYKSVLLFAGAFAAMFFKRVGPIKLILLGGLCGLILY